jgi:hypothetical protein
MTASPALEATPLLAGKPIVLVMLTLFGSPKDRQ